MNENEIELLSNKDIPETVRASIAEQILGAADREAQRKIETQRIQSESQKIRWNTPLVAALAGLVTLSATFAFDRLAAKEQTTNTITLEQMRTEFEQSEARLKQELETAASENLARLEAEAKEREFQYEIVRSELSNADKTNAERADVLLFLTRAGILNALNVEELKVMAEAQRDDPSKNIIPSLTAGDSLEQPASHILVVGSDRCTPVDLKSVPANVSSIAIAVIITAGDGPTQTDLSGITGAKELKMPVDWIVLERADQVDDEELLELVGLEAIELVNESGIARASVVATVYGSLFPNGENCLMDRQKFERFVWAAKQ